MNIKQLQGWGAFGKEKKLQKKIESLLDIILKNESLNKVYMKPFQKLTLPADFAQRLLDNEIQFKLSEKPPAEVICNLIQLYSRGVEYYQSIKSYKYLYFKKKMTELFTDSTKAFAQKENPQQEPVVESPIKQKLNSKNNDERIEALRIKEKQEKLEKEVHQRTKQQQTKKEVEEMIKKVDEKQRKMESNIKSTIENQDKALEEKLKQRKKKSFCKSFSAYGLTESTQTKESLFEDLSPVYTKTDKNHDKGIIEPLIVNFQSVIKDDDSEDEKEMILMKVKAKSIIPKGRMASMGRLVE